MARTLDYRAPEPPKPSASRGTLSRAAMAVAIGAWVVEALLVGVLIVAQVGRVRGLLTVALAILVFTPWFVGIIFAVVAIVERDGPRRLAVGALLVAGVQLIAHLLLALRP